MRNITLSLILSLITCAAIAAADGPSSSIVAVAASGDQIIVRVASRTDKNDENIYVVNKQTVLLGYSVFLSRWYLIFGTIDISIPREDAMKVLEALSPASKSLPADTRKALGLDK